MGCYLGQRAIKTKRRQEKDTFFRMRSDHNLSLEINAMTFVRWLRG
jgi:hypothetical protein